MAHFAKINGEGIVEWVTTLDNSIITDENGIEQESLGVDHILNTIPDADQYTWKQCSRNESFRNIFPSEGYHYIERLNTFVGPKPYDSWSLNDNTLKWESPIGPEPELTLEQSESGYLYEWDELNQQWLLIPPRPELSFEEIVQGKYYEYDYDNKIWVLKPSQ